MFILDAVCSGMFHSNVLSDVALTGAFRFAGVSDFVELGGLDCMEGEDTSRFNLDVEVCPSLVFLKGSRQLSRP